MLQRQGLRSLRLSRSALRSSYSSTTTDNPVPANNPNPEVTKNKIDVASPTNVLPSSSTGGHGRALVEPPEEGEARRQMQAPNRAGVWSRNQQSREKAMIGPRFEQMIVRDQVRYTWASASIAAKGCGGLVMDQWLTRMSTLLASTTCCNRAHPPATRTLDT